MSPKKRSTLVLDGSVTIEGREVPVAVGIGEKLPPISAQHHLAAVQADILSQLNGLSLREVLEKQGHEGVSLKGIILAANLENIDPEKIRYRELPEEVNTIRDYGIRKAAIILLLDDI